MRFGKENARLLWGNTKFVVEGVMPDFLHIIPAGDNTVFDGVFQGKNTSLGLCFVTNVSIFLSHTNHDSLMSWSSNDRWEHRSWCVISGKTGFDHTRSIVDN